MPNLHVKFQVFERDPVAVAVQAGAYYANTTSDNIDGHVIDVPLSLFVSVKVHPRITLHAEGSYVYVRAFGTGDVTRLQVNGATTSRTAQVGLMAQFRLTRIFSLTATGRYQAYTADLPLSGSSSIDPYTSATLNGQLVPASQHPWELIGGVAVLWRHFHMILGAGYGNYFAPGLDIAAPKRSFVPDASLAVVLWRSPASLAGAGALLFAVAVAVTGSGCGPSTVTLPEPPMATETAQLVSVYAMPTAVLNTDNIDQTFADARAPVGDLQLDWLPGLVTDMLTRVKTRLEQGGLPSDPGTIPDDNRPQLTAVVEAHRICSGWNDPAGAPDESANGAIDTTVIVDRGKLNPELWATATACQARVTPADVGLPSLSALPIAVNATLDGTLIIYMLAPLPSSLVDAQFLLTFGGSIGVADQVKTATFDFQYVSGSIKFRIQAGGGDAIVTVGTTFGIAGANAAFSCDLTALTCQSS